MTSDARATELISRHFKDEWPGRSRGVPFAIDGPTAPQGEYFAHISIWNGVSRRIQLLGRHGWIYLRLWVPADDQLQGTFELRLAARAVFDERYIASDDGAIAIDTGECFDVGRDGDWWMSACAFAFRFVGVI